MLLLLSLALSSLGLASANSAVTVVCRTQWQVESADAEGEPVYNVPLVGGQLSWRPVASTAAAPHPKAEEQTAYELEVFKMPTKPSAKPVWTSGKVSGAAQTLSLPSAAALEPDTTYSWRVQLHLSGSTSPTPWGTSTAFSTAPAATVFPGENLWVGGGGQMRAKKPLALPAGKIVRARAFVTGMGAFYLCPLRGIYGIQIFQFNPVFGLIWHMSPSNYPVLASMSDAFHSGAGT